MALLFNKLRLKELAKVPVRYKHGPDHWSTIRRKKTAKDKALAHFDEFYATVYGKTWKYIREALLDEQHKYMAVVNNLSDTQKTRTDLELQGAMHLKAIYDVFKLEVDEGTLSPKRKKYRRARDLNATMDSVLSKANQCDVDTFYPNDYEQHADLSKSKEEVDPGDLPKNPDALDPVQLRSIELDLNEVSLESNRVVNPTDDLSALYEYVPATKIKGLDDWVLESDYYQHYQKGADFEATIQQELVLPFPEHLHVYTFDSGNDTKFKSPKTGSTGVLDYYLFDGASILPVLALDLKPNDVVLDMCAAPGGKTLAILQTLLPRIIVANDVMLSRVNRINNVLQQYVQDVGAWNRKLFVTQQDARTIDEKDIYNKILVDVPCTTDRHVLHSDENNLFKPTRITERLKIPEIQTEILTNALKLVAVGGTVVYSTCSLSPVQNDGVVQLALKKIWEETDSVMIVKDMAPALRPLKHLYTYGKAGLKYGHIVLPTLTKNWGPMYFCKIVRAR